MSLDADKQRSRQRSQERDQVRSPIEPAGVGRALHGSSILGGSLALALSAGTGCSLGTMHPVPSVTTAIADRGTCEGLYVQSIWKGKDISGPQCASYVELGVREAEFDRRRVQKVCEQTQIRTILSGEASTRFTLEACASHEPQYQQARLGRACKQASRVRTQIREDFTPAQTAACQTYLNPPGSSAVALRAASSGSAPRRWGNGLASVSEPPDAGSDARITGAVAPAATAASGAAEESVADGMSCEDRFVESIWKGVDATGGAECAGQVATYRAARIQNVCDGAAVRSVREGQALAPFTAQACQSFFAVRQAAEQGPAPAPALASNAAPTPADAPGLDEKTIAATVDTYWRSIGRDCMAVAPRSTAAGMSNAAGTRDEPAHTPVTVTIQVAASGQVRDVSARVRGHDALESCIERSVRSWLFPSAARDTEIGLPLVFVGE